MLEKIMISLSKQSKISVSTPFFVIASAVLLYCFQFHYSCITTLPLRVFTELYTI